MARETDLSPQDIDAKLASLEEVEEEESEEVEVEPEEETDEEEEESFTSEDDTEDDEPEDSSGDYEEDEELSKSESGLIKAVKAEREKRKETEKMLKEMQETLNNLNQTVTNSQQPRTLEEAYERDEKGVTENINLKIKEADELGDTLEVERLRDLKASLRDSVRKKQETQQFASQKQQELATKLFAAVPDFQKKQPELTKFAIEELGYTDEEIALTNVAKHGENAVREIARINRLYEKTQAKSNVKKKRTKKATTVEKGGKGVPKSAPSHAKLLDEARRTGNWSKVLEDRGL